MSTSLFRRHRRPAAATCIASALMLSVTLGWAASPAVASTHAHGPQRGVASSRHVSQDRATAPAAKAPGFTSTYVYTGAEQAYPVPAGVTALTITALGAPGSGAFAGSGASVTATMPLRKGATTLYVEVGGPGATSPGAFNGGGSSGSGGGGGGASDVRTVSCGSPCNTARPASLASRLLVAGGGGGSGGSGAVSACGGPGGTAGDPSVTGPGNGSAGNDPCGGDGPGGIGGFGGTAGGAGGNGTPNAPCPGNPGSLGQGGSTPSTCASLGGGGGGGYYGGGAGGNGSESGGGGGAGSSFWATGSTGTSMTLDTTGTPEVLITSPVQPPTTNFVYTGAEQAYTVPAGVTAVTVTAVGPPGGSTFGPFGAGGSGASVTATVPLPTGTTTLYVEVGGPGGGFTGGGGFNGGGGGDGGGGGGASDVRTVSCGSPCNTADPASLASRLVVAAGGGGASACGIPGGTAGDTSVTGPGNGGDGYDLSCPNGPGPGGNGGLGGTAGGAGGNGTQNVSCNGSPGSLGLGGSGCSVGGGTDGGGGGGGYYGGGGGGSGGDTDAGGGGGGGGAGSSFWANGATGTSMSKATTNTPGLQITAIRPPDLSLSSKAPATGVIGQPYRYKLTATNTGGAAATSPVVTDTLPASVHFDAATTSLGHCTHTGGAVTCRMRSLAAGGQVIIKIEVTPAKRGTVGDAAKVTASNVTPDSDDRASASTIVH